jgi:hypothetical protein
VGRFPPFDSFFFNFKDSSARSVDHKITAATTQQRKKGPAILLDFFFFFFVEIPTLPKRHALTRPLEGKIRKNETRWS